VEKDALQNLSLIYQAKGNSEKGLEYYKEHIAVKDSMASAAVTEKLAELQVAYETSEKNEEISGLKANEAVAEAVSEKRKKWLIASVLGVVALSLLILVLVLRHRNKVRQSEAEFNQKKMELEQNALRAQMNPHFIFNSLNSIQRLFIEGKMEIANDYMADFSDLMRKILDNSSKAKINIREEINTLKLYLNLEKLRNKEIFDYNILIAEDIDQMNTPVPPMVIQPFVENAIWHGILPKKEKGKIDITLSKNENELVCIIEDNGIGMAESKKKTSGSSTNKIPKHESKGMQLTEQRLGTKIKTDDLDPGTRITLFIPLN
jgi:sensor histidine kinase YesM